MWRERERERRRKIRRESAGLAVCLNLQSTEKINEKKKKDLLARAFS